MNTHQLVTKLQKLKESSRFALAQGGKYDLDDFISIEKLCRVRNCELYILKYYE